MEPRKRGEKRRDLRRKRRRNIAVNILIITMLILMALWCSLPAVIEKIVLPELAKKYRVPCLAADVRCIGIGTVDVADLIMGESPGGGRLAVDSARIDYALSFSGVTIRNVALSGVELDIEFTPEGVKFAGNTLEEWSGRFAGDGSSSGSNSGSNLLKINNIFLEYSKLNLIGNGTVWEFPATLAIHLPGGSNSTFLTCDFRLGQGRDLTTGELKLDAATGEGVLPLNGKVTLQRVLALADSTRDLPLSGSLEFGATAELNAKTGELQGDLNLTTRRLRCAETDAQLAARSHISLRNNLLQLEFSNPSDLLLKFGDLEVVADRLTLTSDPAENFAATAVGELNVNFGDLPPIRLAPELAVDFSDGVTADGSAKVALANSGELDVKLNFATLPAPAATIYAGNDGKPFTAKIFDNTIAVNGLNAKADLLELADGWQVAANVEGKQFELAADGARVKSGAFQAHFELEPNAPPLVALGVDELFCNDLPVHVSRLSAVCELAASEAPAPRPWLVSLSNGVELFGAITATEEGWSLSGTADYQSRFPSPPELEAEIRTVPDFALDVRAKLPPFAIPVELIEPFYPEISRWDLTGNLELEANYKVAGGMSAGAATAAITDAGVNNSEMDLAADNINVKLNFPDLPKLHSSSMQEVNCEKITYSGYEVNDFHALAQLRPDELFVEECSVRAFEGAVKLFCLHLPYDLESVETDVHFERISLAAFINSFSFAYAEGEGHIYGTVPVKLNKHGVSVKNGYLYSEPGVEDKLSIGGLEAVAAGSVELDITSEALKNFVYEWVRIDVDEEGENLLLSATFKGRPENNLPFTFDNEQGGFVRVNYNGAHFQGITVVFNWRVPLNRLLELNNVYQKLTERMQK